MKKNLFLLLIGAMALFSSCKKDDDAPSNQPGGNTVVEAGVEGDISDYNFEANTTYRITGDLIVPEDATVTIPEGVTLEFQEGPNGEAWFLDVYGSLRILGTESARVTLTASDALINSSKNQGFGGLWGGVIGTRTTGDLIIQYADILHAGGVCREDVAMTLPATGGSGENSAGDFSYAIYYVRPGGDRQDGIFVLTHSSVQFTTDDAIRIDGGKTLMTHNFFQVTGGTGGDAVNIKVGTQGDFAYNLFYNLATNGLKAAGANSKGKTEGSIAQTNFYNNTFVNSGYRRAEPGRGAGLNYETKSFGKCYNNLTVNCRFGLRLVAGANQPDMSRMEFGHNYYYGADTIIVREFYPTNSTSSVGMIGIKPEIVGSVAIPESDVAGGVRENNPKFVNFDPSGFRYSGVPATDPLGRNITPLAAGVDFRLQSDSPALTGGKTDFSPLHATYTSLDNELTFSAPSPSAFFGAFGQ